LSSYYTKSQTDTAISDSFNKAVTIKNDNDTNNAFIVNDTTNNNLLSISGAGNLTSSGTLTGTGIFTTGSGGLQIKNGVTTNASITQAGTLSCKAMTCTSITTSGDISNSATSLNISCSGTSLTLKQTGDIYGESSLSMMNRVGQNGFQVATTNTTVTLTDFALQNGAVNSLRTIRLESRIAECTTGQHSIKIGVMSATPTLSIGDNYANVSNKLYIGTQTSINTTPPDVLTVNGSCNFIGAVKCTSCTIGGNTALTSTYIPFHCAGKVSITGSVLFSSGKYSFTSSNTSTGTYTITFSTNYASTNYVITATANNGYSVSIDNNPSTSGFTAYVRNISGGALTNVAFFFTVF
jgi:hypothetical protein